MGTIQQMFDENQIKKNINFTFYMGRCISYISDSGFFSKEINFFFFFFFVFIEKVFLANEFIILLW